MRGKTDPSTRACAARWRRVRGESWPILLLAGFSAIVMRRTLLPGRLPFGYDMAAMFFDMRAFGFRSVADGSLPLWNPYILCGTPFVPGMQSALFYPLNILFLFMPTHSAISTSIFLHLLIAASGMYLLVRLCTSSKLAGLISGLSYGFSGFYVSKILAGQLAPILSIAWVPALVLCGELFIRRRRWAWALGAGLVLGAQALTGHPMYTALGALTLVLYVGVNALLTAAREKSPEVIWGSLALLTVCAATGLGLSAVQTVPGVGLLGQTDRSHRDWPVWALDDSLPPENLLTFLVPGALGHGSVVSMWGRQRAGAFVPRFLEMRRRAYWGRYLSWEVLAYYGVVPFLLGVVGFARRGARILTSLAAIFLVGLFVALGAHNPVMRPAFGAIGHEGIFHSPGRFLLLCTFGGAGMAGLGAAHLLEEGTANTRRRIRIIALLILGGLGLAAVFLARLYTAGGKEAWPRWMNWLASLPGARPGIAMARLTQEVARETSLSSAWTSWVLAAGTATILLLAVAARTHKRKAVAALALLTAIDLGVLADIYVQGMDISCLMWPPEIVSFLRNNLGPYRVSVLAGQFHADRSMYYGIAGIGGYEGFVMRRYSELLERNAGEASAMTPVRLVHNFTRISRLTGVRYVLIPRELMPMFPDVALTKPVLEKDGLMLMEIPDHCPRLRVVHTYRVATDRERALDILASEEFDPMSAVLLESEPEIPIAGPEAPASRAETVHEGLNHVLVHARLSANGVLILGDVSHPGWRARVNGRPWRIVHADWAFRGLILPAGEYDVEFRFQPASFYIGVGGTAVTILALSLWTMIYMLPRGRGRDLRQAQEGPERGAV